ncbi:MAG: dicarboxylate/amino acid:cation symporter [Sedimentisphaerales bacterium]|nr:dicarboxylate/amino acid:cation symporter [Sedimentisphaerales bacterium]
MKLSRLPLHTKILLGLLIGVFFGLLANRCGFSGFVFTYVKPVGSAFIRLISMVIGPLVFASLLVGTASLGDIRKLGRIGAKTMAFYLCTTTIAITIGLLLANAIKPGVGLSAEARARLIQSTDDKVNTQVETSLKKPSILDMLLNIIPTNPIQAFVEGKMLQIIFLALMAGVCLSLIPPERSRPVISLFKGINDLVIQMVHLIMKTAPYGVFAMISAVIADLGLGILLVLCKYSIVMVLGLILHMGIVYSLAIKTLSKQKVRTFFRGIRPAQLIAFSSSSSSATLPATMECTEKNLGVPAEICSFTLPLGATINMDGTALYQGVATVFIAQVYGMNLTVSQQLTVLLTALLASIGTAGIPAAGVIMLAIVLNGVGVPLEGIAIILGVDRILDMCRTVINITGDATCAVIVASSEGERRKQ